MERPLKTTTAPFASDISILKCLLVNCFLVPGEVPGDWVLVDCGLKTSAGKILREARDRFGPDNPPRAILLTHGHFDHTGCIKQLLQRWNVPVYAHRQELPFLTGQAAYPPADPAVGGGVMALSSPLYPRKPIDLGSAVRALPTDGVVPFLPDWRWVHTPGHTPGHVAFYREHDGVLIPGDAFTTTKQESALAVMTQRREMHGPPAYFTPDWHSARESVRRLAALNPEGALPSHGQAWHGPHFQAALHTLAADFEHLGMPDHGKYVPA